MLTRLGWSTRCLTHNRPENVQLSPESRVLIAHQDGLLFSQASSSKPGLGLLVYTGSTRGPAIFLVVTSPGWEGAKSSYLQLDQSVARWRGQVGFSETHCLWLQCWLLDTSHTCRCKIKSDMEGQGVHSSGFAAWPSA